MGCATSGAHPEVRLADVPADLRACLGTLSERPAGTGAMSQREVVALIARLRASELRLSACGHRLLALYDAQDNAGQ